MLTIVQALDVFDAGDARSLLLNAWTTARGGNMLPVQADLSRVMPVDVLQALTVLEVRAPDRVIVIRSAPTDRRMTETDRTGYNLIELAPDFHREDRIEINQRITRRPCAALARMMNRTKSGIYYDMHNLVLPVLPTRPNAPVLIYAALYWTGKTEANLFENYACEMPFAYDIEFIDIGNGVAPMPAQNDWSDISRPPPMASADPLP
jgi:hypothetical protein